MVVEDEDVIRQGVVTALAGAGYAVRALADGAEFTAALAAFRPDVLVLVLVLDWMLPGRDGLALAREARRTCDAGIIVLTARDAVGDRLRGFETGADDYLVKPFVMAELLARVRALARRLGREPTAIEVGDLLIDADAGLATRAGRDLELTATELRLLSYLADNRGRALSKTQILTQVWGYEDYDPNLVEVHVSALRRKSEAHGPRLLHTVRGIGYTLRP